MKQVKWHQKEFPTCDICGAKNARFDDKTVMGPWGYLCPSCQEKYGVGIGFKLVL